MDLHGRVLWFALALAGCSTSADRPAPPRPADRVEAAASESHRTAPALRDVFALPPAGERPGDRLIRFDGRLASSGSADLPGEQSYGALVADGSRVVLLVPAPPNSPADPQLVVLDAETLAETSRETVPRRCIPRWRGRPKAALFTGEAAPGLAVVPLRALESDGRQTSDVVLRVVDATSGRWTDVPGPHDVTLGALLRSSDASLHAAVTTESHELFDVDLTHAGGPRAVTNGAFLPAPSSSPGAVALRGFVLLSPTRDLLAVDRNGRAVRISFDDGSVRPVELPIDGLGTTAFVEDVAWSPRSQRLAIEVLRAGDPGNFPSHVVLLDAEARPTGAEIDTRAGIAQVAFAPGGEDLVLLTLDGELLRHRVSDGALVAASAPGLRLEAIVGVR